MKSLTIGLGVFLVLLGLGAYGWSMRAESASVTALIPAFFGVPMIGLGLLAGSARYRKLAMHLAVVLALLGFLGAGLRGLASLPTLLRSADEIARPAAVVVQSVMAVACLAFVIAGVMSFVRARRAAGSTTPAS